MAFETVHRSADLIQRATLKKRLLGGDAAKPYPHPLSKERSRAQPDLLQRDKTAVISVTATPRLAQSRVRWPYGSKGAR